MGKKQKKVHRKYTSPAAFHWQSDLSARRKQQLIEWEASLSDEDRQKLHDLLDDVREEGEEAGEAAGTSM